MDKLVELVRVQQRPGEGYRRCFGSNCFDLWVWYSEDRASLLGFQLIWADNTLAVTWSIDGGFSYRRISDEGFGIKVTPLLEGDAGTVHPLLIPIFTRCALDIDKELTGFIVDKIMSGAGITQQMIDAAEKEHPDLPEYLLRA
jgi:hypothetical protein